MPPRLIKFIKRGPKKLIKMFKKPPSGCNYLSSIGMYAYNYNGTAQCIVSMAKSIGGTLFIHCMEVVRISESPLREVPLYNNYAHVLRPIKLVTFTISLGYT